MASVPSSSLQFSNSFTLTSPPPNPKLHNSKPFTFTIRAADPESSPSEPGSDSADFEDRLAKIRLKYRSGTGKKAELRKARKSNKSTGSSTGSSVYLPPVPLKEPVSGGLTVDSGFTPFSERINGRIAMLGLTALILVELATGKGVINYHTPAIILIQVYFVAAIGAVYVKFEKEKVSVWPQSSAEEIKN